MRARRATRTLGGRRRGEGLGLEWEEPGAQSNWRWTGLRRMRSPRLSAEPELVARGSFRGARVEGKQQPRFAPACTTEVGRGKEKLLLGAEKAGKWTALVSNRTVWMATITFDESAGKNQSVKSLQGTGAFC